MKLFKKNKKEEVVLVDENGNPVQKEKGNGKGKQIVKKVLFGLCAAGVGVATFIAVGLALGATADSEEETSNWVGDGSTGTTEENCSESSDGETSGEE